MKTQQKKRPHIFAKRQIPSHPKNIAELVRSLTIQIQRITKDLTNTQLGYRNGRTRRALECAIDERARVLDILINTSFTLYQQLVAELGLIQNTYS